MPGLHHRGNSLINPKTGERTGAMSEEEDLTYGRYLRIGELLALQRPRSRPPHPEELHFIIVHQAIELWMKLLLHDLERIIAALDAADWAGALALLGRVNQVMTHVLDQMRTLHTLPPWALAGRARRAGRAVAGRPRPRHRRHGAHLAAPHHPLPLLPGAVGAARRAGRPGRRRAGRQTRPTRGRLSAVGEHGARSGRQVG